MIIVGEDLYDILGSQFDEQAIQNTLEVLNESIALRSVALTGEVLSNEDGSGLLFQNFSNHPKPKKGDSHSLLALDVGALGVNPKSSRKNTLLSYPFSVKGTILKYQHTKKMRELEETNKALEARLKELEGE